MLDLNDMNECKHVNDCLHDSWLWRNFILEVESATVGRGYMVVYYELLVCCKELCIYSV